MAFDNPRVALLPKGVTHISFCQLSLIHPQHNQIVSSVAGCIKFPVRSLFLHRGPELTMLTKYEYTEHMHSARSKRHGHTLAIQGGAHGWSINLPYHNRALNLASSCAVNEI